jgi:hypothetical protein
MRLIWAGKGQEDEDQGIPAFNLIIDGYPP